MHRGTVGAAVNARGDGRSEFAVGAREAFGPEHDGIIKRRALLYRFGIMREDESMGTDGPVRRRDLQRLALLRCRVVEFDGREPRLPLELALGEVAHRLHPRQRIRPWSRRSRARTNDGEPGPSPRLVVHVSDELRQGDDRLRRKPGITEQLQMSWL